jgi:hypothetical protein
MNQALIYSSFRIYKIDFDTYMCVYSLKEDIYSVSEKQQYNRSKTISFGMASSLLQHGHRYASTFLTDTKKSSSKTTIAPWDRTHSSGSSLMLSSTPPTSPLSFLSIQQEQQAIKERLNQTHPKSFELLQIEDQAVQELFQWYTLQYSADQGYITIERDVSSC